MDVLRLGPEGRWSLLADLAENDRVRAEPFREIEISLGDFWLESIKK
jgi:hypothetical protein